MSSIQQVLLIWSIPEIVHKIWQSTSHEDKNVHFARVCKLFYFIFKEDEDYKLFKQNEQNNHIVVLESYNEHGESTFTECIIDDYDIYPTNRVDDYKYDIEGTTTLSLTIYPRQESKRPKKFSIDYDPPEDDQHSLNDYSDRIFHFYCGLSIHTENDWMIRRFNNVKFIDFNDQTLSKSELATIKKELIHCKFVDIRLLPYSERSYDPISIKCRVEQRNKYKSFKLF